VVEVVGAQEEEQENLGDEEDKEGMVEETLEKKRFDDASY
jgi:hypothetical protein